MLNVNDLKGQIQAALENTVVPAIYQCKYNDFAQDGEFQQEKASEMAETFRELVCEPLADAIANAIDYYVKNAAITGQIMIYPSQIVTVGNKHTQANVAPVIMNITSMPIPSINGTIPNTLGIS